MPSIKILKAMPKQAKKKATAVKVVRVLLKSMLLIAYKVFLKLFELQRGNRCNGLGRWATA